MGRFREVRFEEINNKGIITLNRPKSLNALTFSVLSEIAVILKQWENEKDLVIIKANGDKAFCAGGDIRYVYEELKEKNTSLPFRQQLLQLQLAYLIKTYKIPIISLINGITMGAGSALSIHCKFCIATEKTSFAMPEVGIGILTDAGTTYVFPRLPGKLGLYLALTCERLTGADMCQVGLASHFCQSTNLPQLEKELLKSSANVDDILQKNSVKNFPVSPLTFQMSKINYFFSADTVEEIYDKLENDSSDWAKNTLEVLKKKSPTSLKITLKAINLAKHMEFIDCLKMEYKVNCDRLREYDFSEGVRAVILDKDFNPKWNPPKLQTVTDEDIEKYFSFLPKIGKLFHKL